MKKALLKKCMLTASMALVCSVAKADFSDVWTMSPSPWSTEVATDVPDGVAVCSNTAGVSDSNPHTIHMAEAQVFASASTATITFTYTHGSHMLMIAGVDVIASDGTTVASSDYHEGKAGGSVSNNVYTLSNLTEGEAYTLRYFVCSKASGNNSHNITQTNGTITATGIVKNFYAEAVEAYACSGVGYPASDADSRTTLKSCIDAVAAEANSTTCDALYTALVAFKTDTDIQLPEDGKAYTFANRSLYYGGTTRYLNYTSGSALSISSTNSTDASVFVCRELRDGVYVFVSEDGKFLTWMGNGDGYTADGALSGYSSSYPAEQNDLADWNEITVLKQSTSSHCTGLPQSMFGMLQMTGRRSSSMFSSFIATDAGGWDRADTTTFYNNNYSSAWYITEVADYVINDAQKTALASITPYNAKAALACSGPGYPVAEAESRTALQTCLDATATGGMTTTEHDNLESALTTYKTDTNIQLPEDGKAYTFANYSLYNGGTTRYLKYNAGSKMTINSTDSAEASVFVCHELSDGVYVFVTNDGNYMTWVGNTDGGNGYSETYPLEKSGFTDWNQITIQSHGSTESEFGLLKMYGPRHGSSATYSYFIVKGTEGIFDQASISQTYFQSSGSYFSSAWYITEVADYEVPEAQNNAHLYGIAASELSKYTISDAVCDYSYTINGAKLTNYDDVIAAINASSSCEEIQAILDSRQINLPETGKYYRLKGYSGNYIDASEIYATDASGNQQMAMNAADAEDFSEAGTIFYLDSENRFKNAYTGNYVYLTSCIGATKEDANTWTFAEYTTTDLTGYITLTANKVGGYGNQLHDNDNNGGTRADRCSSVCGERHAWKLEEVEMTYLLGEGTEEKPFLISSIDDLVLFRNLVNDGDTTYNAEGVYVAVDDNIDMSSVDWSVNIGEHANASLDGIFDGKGYTLKNLVANECTADSWGYVCTGLFGAISGSAVVKNFTLENVTISTGNYTGNNAAAVVGFAYKATGSIENVNVTGNVNINAAGVTGTGVIVGYDYQGSLTISNCTVDVNNGSSVTGAAYVGGIIGYAYSGITLNENSVNNLSVNATSCCAGGLAGIMLAGGSADSNTVNNVALTSQHENWQNSVGIAVGAMTNGSITVANSTFASVTANGEKTTSIVGSEHADKPSAPVAKVAARIADVYCTPLSKAFAAVADDETITVLTDITLTESNAVTSGTYVDGLVYNGDKSFTVDFGGFTVVDDGCVNDYVIYLKNTGSQANEVTFTNGTIKSLNGCWSSLCVGSASGVYPTTINLNGMTIENSNCETYSGNDAVRIRTSQNGNCTANVNEGTTITSNGASYGIIASTAGAIVNINNGATIVQTNSGVSGGNNTYAAVSGLGTVNINEGATITSDNYGVYTMTSANPVVNISGGTITATEAALVAATNSGDGQTAIINVSNGTFNGELRLVGSGTTISLTGGTYDRDVTEFCATGYECVENGLGGYTVQKKPATAITEVELLDSGSTIYDLQGRRVAKATKGNLYIINGTKTIVK